MGKRSRRLHRGHLRNLRPVPGCAPADDSTTVARAHPHQGPGRALGSSAGQETFPELSCILGFLLFPPPCLSEVPARLHSLGTPPDCSSSCPLTLHRKAPPCISYISASTLASACQGTPLSQGTEAAQEPGLPDPERKGRARAHVLAVQGATWAAPLRADRPPPGSVTLFWSHRVFPASLLHSAHCRSCSQVRDVTVTRLLEG